MGLFQMYGRYTKDLGEYAKDEARKLKILERRRKQEDKIRNKVSETYTLFDMPLHLFLFKIQTPSTITTFLNEIDYPVRTDSHSMWLFANQ